MSNETNQTEQLNQIEQLLAEINAVYLRPFHKLPRPEGTDEIYDTAFQAVSDARMQLRQQLSQVFGASMEDVYFSRDLKEVAAHLKTHKAWIVFLKMLRGHIDILLYQDAPNSSALWAGEGLVEQWAARDYLRRAEAASMQPQEQEEDPGRTPLPDKLDRGDVLHMPPIAG